MQSNFHRIRQKCIQNCWIPSLHFFITFFDSYSVYFYQFSLFPYENHALPRFFKRIYSPAAAISETKSTIGCTHIQPKSGKALFRRNSIGKSSTPLRSMEMAKASRLKLHHHRIANCHKRHCCHHPPQKRTAVFNRQCVRNKQPRKLRREQLI